MILNEFGRVANNEWMNTPNIRKNIELGEFIIMPNHMHGIIQIMHAAELHALLCIELNSRNSSQMDAHDIKELHSLQSRQIDARDNKESNSLDNNELNPPDHKGVCKTPPQSPQTIGAIVRGYKSSVTRQLGILGLNDKLWQRNYYEHIIRDEKSHKNISNYIVNNPEKWEKDKFYK
jgi:REP element-mobilizing transposase RayT